MVDDTEVHATHCCHRCGCKYGDEDCPVVLGGVVGISRSECDYCCDDTDIDAEQYVRELRESHDRMLAEMKRYLPVLEKLEKDDDWNYFTDGTGIATANGYRDTIKRAEEV